MNRHMLSNDPTPEVLGNVGGAEGDEDDEDDYEDEEGDEETDPTWAGPSNNVSRSGKGLIRSSKKDPS